MVEALQVGKTRVDKMRIEITIEKRACKKRICGFNMIMR